MTNDDAYHAVWASGQVGAPGLSSPIAFIDEGGGIGPLFTSVDDLVSYLEWPDQFDDPARAYDAVGRRLRLTVELPSRRVVVLASPETDREGLESRLRSIARDRPMRFGLLDADVDLDTLLRALWPHMRYRADPFPTE